MTDPLVMPLSRFVLRRLLEIRLDRKIEPGEPHAEVRERELKWLRTCREFCRGEGWVDHDDRPDLVSVLSRFGLPGQSMSLFTSHDSHRTVILNLRDPEGKPRWMRFGWEHLRLLLGQERHSDRAVDEGKIWKTPAPSGELLLPNIRRVSPALPLPD